MSRIICDSYLQIWPYLDFLRFITLDLRAFVRTETPISPTGIIHLCINLFDLAPPVRPRPYGEADLGQLGLVLEVLLVPHDKGHEVGLALIPAVV